MTVCTDRSGKKKKKKGRKEGAAKCERRREILTTDKRRQHKWWLQKIRDVMVKQDVGGLDMEGEGGGRIHSCAVFTWNLKSFSWGAAPLYKRKRPTPVEYSKCFVILTPFTDLTIWYVHVMYPNTEQSESTQVETVLGFSRKQSNAETQCNNQGSTSYTDKYWGGNMSLIWTSIFLKGLWRK